MVTNHCQHSSQILSEFKPTRVPCFYVLSLLLLFIMRISFCLHFIRNETVIGVSAGDSHSLVCTLQGTVYGWGCYKDKEGKEFFNATSERQILRKQSRPMRLPGLEHVLEVSKLNNRVISNFHPWFLTPVSSLFFCDADPVGCLE